MAVTLKFYCILVLSTQPTSNLETRMHSSRMGTGRSLTVCRSLLLGEVYLVPGGVLTLGDVLSPGGCLTWGALLQGGV